MLLLVVTLVAFPRRLSWVMVSESTFVIHGVDFSDTHLFLLGGAPLLIFECENLVPGIIFVKNLIIIIIPTFSSLLTYSD